MEGFGVDGTAMNLVKQSINPIKHGDAKDERRLHFDG